MQENIENLVESLNLSIKNYGEAFLIGAMQTTAVERFVEADRMFVELLYSILQITSPFFMWETINEDYVVCFLKVKGEMKRAYKIFGTKVFRVMDLGTFKGDYALVGDFPTLLEAKLGAVMDYAKCMRDETV